MIQISRSRVLGLVVSSLAAISLPLSASAATHTRTNRPSLRISCGRDYTLSNGSCSVNLSALGLVDFASTPDVAIIHVGPHSQAGATLDSEIDPGAIQIAAPAGPPSAVATYVVQQIRQHAASGQQINLVVTVGGTNAVSPLFNRAIAPAVVPAATEEVGGANAVDGTLALADMLALYQRGGLSAVQLNTSGLATVALRGYGPILWPAKQ